VIQVPAWTGNDVVDLTARRIRALADNPRFRKRVLAASEEDWLATRPGSVDLWAVWSAKEAAFKAVSKLLGSPPVFRHAAFVTELEDAGRADLTAFLGAVSCSVTGSPPELAYSLVGTVRHGTDTVRVCVWVAATAVHAVGVANTLRSGRPATDRLPSTRPFGLACSCSVSGGSVSGVPVLSARESALVRTPWSASVRTSAKEGLAAVLAVDPGRIEILSRPVGSAGGHPPYVVVDGREAPVDVSLSHDGPWIAWSCTYDSNTTEE